MSFHFNFRPNSPHPPASIFSQLSPVLGSDGYEKLNVSTTLGLNKIRATLIFFFLVKRFISLLVLVLYESYRFSLYTLISSNLVIVVFKSVNFGHDSNNNN